jgi:hypothetical protein
MHAAERAQALEEWLTQSREVGLRLGLLMNFGAATFREGIKRVVNSRAP